MEKTTTSSDTKFRDLISAVGHWSQANFGDQPPTQPALGIGEEIGELLEATCHIERVDALGDIVIYTCDTIYRLFPEDPETWPVCEWGRLVARRAADRPAGQGMMHDRRALAWALVEQETLFKEYGRLCHNVLKTTQGIRGEKPSQALFEAFLYRLYCYTDMCPVSAGIRTFRDIVGDRNWAKFPKNGIDE